ncbi:histidine kinase [Lentzea alba]|uniref:sensor histidine kinase n=1 Tax=Lentzea alba TaxID=2714351 RepID=UPI0039BF6514
MSGSHSLVPRLTPRVAALGRELALLAFVGVVTYMATQYVTVDWGPAPCDDPAVGAVVAGASVVPVLLRRHLPEGAVLVAAALFGWYPATGIALALASYSVAARVQQTRWRAVVVAVAALLPFSIGLVGSGYQWKVVFIEFGIAALVTVVGPVAVQTLLAQREQLVGALREQSRYAGSTARLQERSRIAQEMHDLLGHRLSLISLYAGSLELDATRQVSEPARLIRTTVRTAMEELRATLGILRQPEPAATSPADQTGTRADIFQLVRQAQDGGVRVTLTWTGDDLSEVVRPVRQAVHRIVREGLTNVCRHAPDAQAEVVVEHGSDHVRVGVFDDGRAAAAAPGTGLGLAGVQERVRLLGGSFAAGPLPGKGFRVTAELSLTPTAPAAETPDGATDEGFARAGMSAVLATGLIGAVAILVVTFNTVMFQLPDESAQPPYETLSLGSTRDQVAEYAGPDSTIARVASRGVEPLPPPNSDCSYTYFEENGAAMIERFCFRRDLLVEKTRFALPAV